jgi:iron complex outermembrane recepter protein
MTDQHVRSKRNGASARMLLLGASVIALSAAAASAYAQTNISSGDTAPLQTSPAQDNGASDNSAPAAAAGAPKGAPTSPVAATANGNEVSNTTNEVVVTGLRGSLQRDLDIKRNSTGIVDAISAEDIGKFPDSNIAEAIQRIPGISVSRGASSLGTTSTGDATEITVRGFGPTFNETLYDDRQISAGTSDRGFDFSAVGADFVGEIDVLKTPDASLSAGAIGATINIKYPKPFDHPGPRFAGSLSTTYSPEDGHATPNGGVLVSDTFLNDTVGLLADVAYSDHKTRADHESIQGWVATQFAPSQLAGAAPGASTAQTINGWLPREWQLLQEHDDTSREDARLVLQWKPLGDKLLVTLNDDYSRERIDQVVNGLSVWFNNDAPGTVNGISPYNIVQGADGTARSFLAPNEPTDIDGQYNKQVLENNEYGFNAKYDVNDSFTTTLDLDRSESQLSPNGQVSVGADVGYGNNNAGNVLPGAVFGENTQTTGVVIGKGLPYLTSYGPSGNLAQLNNPALVGSHVMVLTSQQNDDVVSQAKIQGNYHSEDLQIRFGVQYIGDHEHERGYNTIQNSNWQAYSGYGPPSGAATGVAIPAGLLTSTFSTNNYLPGFSSNNLPPSVLRYSGTAVINYLQGLGNPQTKTIPGYSAAGAPNYAGVFALAEAPGSHIDVGEDTLSGFLTASQKTQVFQMPLVVNFGVREEVTRTKVGGLGQEPTALTRAPSDETLLNVAYGPESEVTSSNIQANFLPNLDMALSLTNKLKLRLDASRTLTHPPLADLNPATTVAQGQRIGGLSATGGDPDLLPFTSDNGDLGLEWYYQRNSYISIDGFVKHVSNFVVAGATRETINGVTDPTTGALAQFAVTTNVNGPSATIDGIEAALQHTFWDTGFGFQLNATIVGSDHPYDRENLSVSGFAVTGLADSANLVAFYDKNGFQARVAVNWRDSYLDHFGQAQGSNLFGAEPTFVDSNTTVDFSTSYDVTKNLSVYFEANNLTDSGYFTHGRFSEQFLDGVSYGRRFTLGAHLRY